MYWQLQSIFNQSIAIVICTHAPPFRVSLFNCICSLRRGNSTKESTSSFLPPQRTTQSSRINLLRDCVLLMLNNVEFSSGLIARVTRWNGEVPPLLLGFDWMSWLQLNWNPGRRWLSSYPDYTPLLCLYSVPNHRDSEITCSVEQL